MNRTSLYLLAGAGMALGVLVAAVRATPSSAAVYAETYFPDDTVTRDLRLSALSAEYEFRPRRPLLQPLGLGVIGSLHTMSGNSIRNSDPLRMPLDGDGEGVSASVLLRLNAIETERFSAYMDLAAGGIWTADEWPSGGTEVNGIFRFGAGARYAVHPEWDIMGGFRYLHISNGGGLNDGNPAYDSMGLYFGVSWAPGGERRSAARQGVALSAPALGLSLGFEGEYFFSPDDFFADIGMQALNAVYEYRFASVPQLAFVGTGSFYYVSGHQSGDGRGLGVMNAGSVGQGLNAGGRFYFWRRERVELFAEGSVGGIIHFTRTWPFGDANEPAHRFTNPLSWLPAVRYGVGARFTLSENRQLTLGYRHLNIRNLESPDLPDYRGDGFFLGLMTSF